MLRLGLACTSRACSDQRAVFLLRFTRASLSPSEYRPLGLYPSFLAHPVSFPFRVSLQHPLVSSLVSRGNSPWNHQIFGRALRREGKRFGAKISNRERGRDIALSSKTSAKTQTKKAKYSDIYFPRFCQILPQIFASDSDQLSDSKGNSLPSVYLSSITGKNSRVARSWTTP